MEKITTPFQPSRRSIIRVGRQSFILSDLSVYIIQNSSKTCAQIAREVGIAGSGVIDRRSDALELMFRNANIDLTYSQLAELLQPYEAN